VRRVVTILVGTLLSGAFYLLLIDTVSLPELYVLAGVALLSGLLLELSRRQGFTEAKVHARWLLRGWRPIAQVPLHILLVTREAVAQLLSRKPARGEFRAVSFRGGDSSEDRGRRALAEALGSFAPNTIVIGVDLERDLLLVHQLYTTGSPEKLDVLGLG
jgi:hypothetical protein